MNLGPSCYLESWNLLTRTYFYLMISFKHDFYLFYP